MSSKVSTYVSGPLNVRGLPISPLLLPDSHRPSHLPALCLLPPTRRFRTLRLRLLPFPPRLSAVDPHPPPETGLVASVIATATPGPRRLMSASHHRLLQPTLQPCRPPNLRLCRTPLSLYRLCPRFSVPYPLPPLVLLTSLSSPPRLPPSLLPSLFLRPLPSCPPTPSLTQPLPIRTPSPWTISVEKV